MRLVKKTRMTTRRLCTTEGCQHRLDPYDGHDRCFACLGERHFIDRKDVQCPHCMSLNASSYRNRQRKREKLMEEAGLPGKGATRWGSYRIPLRQGSPHHGSSDNESGRGNPDIPEPPIDSTNHRGLQVKLTLRDSPPKESEAPAVTSRHRQLCAQTLFSMSQGGWSPPSPLGRWLGLPRHNCHSVAG